MLSDIARIWTSTKNTIPGNHREQLSFYTVDTFVAIAQSSVAANGTPLKLSPHAVLRLPGIPLECCYSPAMATHAITMILNLGSSTQVTTFVSGIGAEPPTEALLNVRV